MYDGIGALLSDYQNFLASLYDEGVDDGERKRRIAKRTAELAITAREVASEQQRFDAILNGRRRTIK